MLYMLLRGISGAGCTTCGEIRSDDGAGWLLSVSRPVGPQNMSEAKPPVVLIGERGCGKSALLANWVKSRRARRQPPGASPELVFLHLAGASRESNLVSTLLLRAVSEMKAFFGLQVCAGVDESPIVAVVAHVRSC